jgi:hypothetical protein
MQLPHGVRQLLPRRCAAIISAVPGSEGDEAASTGDCDEEYDPASPPGLFHGQPTDDAHRDDDPEGSDRKGSACRTGGTSSLIVSH